MADLWEGQEAWRASQAQRRWQRLLWWGVRLVGWSVAVVSLVIAGITAGGF